MSYINLEHKELRKNEMIKRSSEFYQLMNSRRSIRHFSNKDVPIEIIKNIIKTASTAPSGANKQPWKFVIVKDKNIKKQIRIAAEKEEKEFYEHRAPRSWLDDLKILGTDWEKGFLETAPYLIVIFKELYTEKSGELCKHYYINFINCLFCF